MVNDGRIYDMRSLAEARYDRMICSLLESLDGAEFEETLEKDGSTDIRTYVIFGARMYMASKNRDPKTGKVEETFAELRPEDAIEVLLRCVNGLRAHKY